MWLNDGMNLLADMLALVAVVAMNAPPFDFGDSDQVEGRIQKPSVFTVVSPPAELGLSAAPSPDVLARAEARLASGERRAVDLMTRAHALSAAARTRFEADLDRWLAAQGCADEGRCPPPGEPPVADFRPALAALAEAETTLDVEPMEVERLAIEAVLAAEPGPGFDDARAARALERLADLVRHGPLAAWARLMRAERAFEEADMQRARTFYEATLVADPTSSLGPFVRYKLAWTLVNLDELDQAVAAFRAIVEGDAIATIGAEAERDLVVVYTMLPDRASDAVGFFGARNTPRTNRNLLALAEGYLDDDRRAAAREVLAALDRRVLEDDVARDLARLRARAKTLLGP